MYKKKITAKAEMRFDTAVQVENAKIFNATTKSSVLTVRFLRMAVQLALK